MLVTNVLQNGNFDDLTGWTAGTRATHAIANNILSNTGNGANANPFEAQVFLQTPPTAGDKYYNRIKWRVTNSLATALNIMIGYENMASAFIRTTYTANTWYTDSGIAAVPASLTKLDVSYYHQYSSTADANGAVLEIQDAFTVNLTALFGAGKEPTVAFCDAFFKNWFEGTRDLALNILPDGNFDDITTHWTAGTRGTHSVVGDILTHTSNGTSTNPNERNDGLTPIPAVGDKIYMSARLRNLGTVCNSIDIRAYDGVNSLRTLETVNDPVQNTWYNFSGIDTYVSGGTDYYFYAYHNYSTISEGDGQQMELQYPLAINLTQTFGAGHEPTLAECDLAFANWFDGSRFIARNILENSNFVDGTNWSFNCTYSIANNEITITNLGSSGDYKVWKTASLYPMTVGHLYYAQVSMLSNSSDDGILENDTLTGDGHTGSGEYEILGVRFAPPDTQDEIRYLNSTRSGDISANPVKIKEALLIDLTTTFGAGNEPTNHECKILFSTWFNEIGVMSLPTNGLDVVYLGEPFCYVAPASLLTESLDIVYLGEPFVASELYDDSGDAFTIYVNIGGTWKTAIGIYLNIGGTWKTALLAKGNIGGVWK